MAPMEWRCYVVEEAVEAEARRLVPSLARLEPLALVATEGFPAVAVAVAEAPGLTACRTRRLAMVVMVATLFSSSRSSED